MTAVICLDEQGGISFGGRRQSRDRLLCADAVRLCGRLKMLPGSARLFAAHPEAVEVCSELLREDGAYFVETDALDRAEPEELIIYRWNRLYPADCRLVRGPEERGMQLVSREDFAGSSHARITREIWRKPHA